MSPPRVRPRRRGAHGDVRVGPILAIPALLREHGLDPARVLGMAGLDAGLFVDADNRVSLRALGHLLDTCVRLTRCPHFGLQVGARSDVRALGALGLLMRSAPTVRDALRVATQHSDLQDRAAVSLMLDVGRSRVALGYSLFDGRMPAADQILDGAIAIHFGLLRDLCGPSWKPLAIQLSHGRPRGVAPFRKLFGTTPEFNARVSAVVFDSKWLDHRIAGADPAQLSGLVEALARIESRDASSFVQQVRRAAHALMLTGSATSAGLARLFNVHERTLRRRLAEGGTTLRELVGDVRHELAQHLLRNTTLPVSEIASTLSYSDGAVFARAFRARAKASPRKWRAKFRGAS